MGSWHHALSGLRAGAGTELLAAVTAARSRVLGPPMTPSAEAGAVASILFGTTRYDTLIMAREGGFAALGHLWGWTAPQVESAVIAVQALIGKQPAQGGECLCQVPTELGELSVFPHLSMLALAIVAHGLEWEVALPLLAHCQLGRFNDSGTEFWLRVPTGLCWLPLALDRGSLTSSRPALRAIRTWWSSGPTAIWLP